MSLIVEYGAAMFYNMWQAFVFMNDVRFELPDSS